MPKKLVIWSAPALVAAVAAAATVDAFVFDASSGAPTSSSEAASSPAAPSTTTEAAPIPSCSRGQLAFSIRLIERTPIAVLRHVRGQLCRQPVIPLSVRIVPAKGDANGELLGPEGALNGLYAPGGEERVAFRYWPTCTEQGPFLARVRAGNFSARRTIPVDPGCFPSVQRRIAHLGPGREKASFSVQALNPATHALTVRIVLPHRASVAITIEDRMAGPTVHVLDDARRRDWCHGRGTVDVCLLDFGALETQSPGAWTVRVRKRSSPPATVRIEIMFEALR